MGILKKLGLGIIGFFIIIFIIGSTTPSNDQQNKTSTSETNTKIKIYSIGESVVIDNINYTLNNWWLYEALGNQLTIKEADGIFLVTDLSIENIGKNKEYISYTDFEIIDSQNRVYDVDTSALVYLKIMDLETVSLDDLGPGLKKEHVYFAFDIPEDDIPNNETSLKLKITNGLFSDTKYFKIN